jgi:hypothetical protein
VWKFWKCVSVARGLSRIPTRATAGARWFCTPRLHGQGQILLYPSSAICHFQTLSAKNGFLTHCQNVSRQAVGGHAVGGTPEVTRCCGATSCLCLELSNSTHTWLLQQLKLVRYVVVPGTRIELPNISRVIKARDDVIGRASGPGLL